MTDLHAHQQAQGATLAPDQIPLQYGSLNDEYQAALNSAILMDRSHEGRLWLRGADGIEIMHRISTNDLHGMANGEARATVFTNANARILDRADVYNLPDGAFVLTEPGRGPGLTSYLQRNIFFNDDAAAEDVTNSTYHFVLHGPDAEAVLKTIAILPETDGQRTTINGADILVLKRKPLRQPMWSIIVGDPADGIRVWDAILNAGAPKGLLPAGSLTFNALRIGSGRPAAGRELSADYIPLEVGLWDEISFTKGCYTGQEIIARMESRGRLSKTIVHMQPESPMETPADLLVDGKKVGRLTSYTQAPDGEQLGVGVVRVEVARPDVVMATEDGTQVRVLALAGQQPPDHMLKA